MSLNESLGPLVSIFVGFAAAMATASISGARLMSLFGKGFCHTMFNQPASLVIGSGSFGGRSGVVFGGCCWVLLSG